MSKKYNLSLTKHDIEMLEMAVSTSKLDALKTACRDDKDTNTWNSISDSYQLIQLIIENKLLKIGDTDE